MRKTQGDVIQSQEAEVDEPFHTSCGSRRGRGAVGAGGPGQGAEASGCRAPGRGRENTPRDTPARRCRPTDRLINGTIATRLPSSQTEPGDPGLPPPGFRHPYR